MTFDEWKAAQNAQAAQTPQKTGPVSFDTWKAAQQQGLGDVFGDLQPGQQFQQGPAPEVPTTMGQAIQGGAEAGGQMLAGIVGGLPGMVYGTGKGLTQAILDGSYGTPEASAAVEQAAMQGMEAGTKFFTGEMSPTGQRYAQNIATAAAPLMALGPVGMPLAAPEMALAGGLARQAAPQAVAAVNVARGAAGEGVQAARQRLQSVMGSEQSAPAYGEGMSAGSAAVPLQDVRAAMFANLPVPITPARSAVTRLPEHFGEEAALSKMAKTGRPLRDLMEENMQRFNNNWEYLIDDIGGTTLDQTETGMGLVGVLNSGLKQAKAKTSAAYSRARKSEEANAPVDMNLAVTIGEGEDAISNSLIGYLNSKLPGLRSTQVNTQANSVLENLGLAAKDENGKLVALPATVRQMEEARKEIGRLAKWDDPEGLREQTILKGIIDDQTAQVAGPLYKEARALRVEQGDKFQNRAIVADLLKIKKASKDRVVPMEKVFDRTVKRGTTEELGFLKKLLLSHGPDGEQVWADLQGEFVKYIRDEAGKGHVTDKLENTLQRAGRLHEVVQNFDKTGKLQLMAGHKNAQVIRDLNDSLRYMVTAPPGTLINHSGTAQTLMDRITGSGLLGGLVKIGKQQIQNAKDRKKVDRAINWQAPPSAN